MPEIGRFISEDPWKGTILTPTTMNPYPYVVNNPLKYVDPSGLMMVVDGTGDVLYNPHTKNFIYNSSAAEKAHEKVLNKQAKKSSSPVTKVSNQVQKQETKNGSNAIYGKLSGNVKDFVTGVSVSVDNNVFFKGAQTITGNTVFPDTDAFKVGKVVGDAASIAIGVAGTIAGGAEVAGGIAGGIVAAPATGGASVVLGGAVAVEGVALTAAGVVVTGVSASNFVEDTLALFDGNGSKSGRPKKGQEFRGGSKNQRDNWYGYNDKDFQNWWHRKGKREWGGEDIQDNIMAKEVYDYWLDIGKPKVK